MTAQIDGVRVILYHHGDSGACIYVGESEKTGGDADRLVEKCIIKAGVFYETKVKDKPGTVSETVGQRISGKIL